MEPSSAATALPTRPESTMAVSSGPSSISTILQAAVPTNLSATKFWNSNSAQTVATMPVKMDVTNNSGSEDTPMEIICFTMRSGFLNTCGICLSVSSRMHRTSPMLAMPSTMTCPIQTTGLSRINITGNLRMSSRPVASRRRNCIQNRRHRPRPRRSWRRRMSCIRERTIAGCRVRNRYGAWRR